MGGQDRIRAVVVDTVCVMGVAINPPPPPPPPCLRLPDFWTLESWFPRLRGHQEGPIVVSQIRDGRGADHCRSSLWYFYNTDSVGLVG